MKNYLVIGMVILLHIKAYSQLSINSRSGLSSNSYMTMDEMWDLTVINPTGLTYINSSLNLTLSNNQGVVYTATALPLTISANGNVNINKGSFKTIKENFVDKAFKTKYDSLLIIPSGSYIICYTIYSEKDSMAICNYCKSITIENISDKPKKYNSIINSTGFMQLAGFFAFGSDTLPRNPLNYYVWRGNPIIELLNYPIRADFQFNMVDNKIDANTTYFNYSFDGDRFRSNLKKKAEQEAKKQLKKHTQYTAVYEKSKNELNKINTILNNPVVQKEIYLSQLRDSLKKILDKKLNPLRDSLQNLRGEARANMDSIQENVKDSLDNANNIIPPIKTDSLKSAYSNLKDSLSVDSLITRIKADSTLLSKLPLNIDSLKLLIDNYKKLDYLATKGEAYKQLLDKKKKLGKLMAAADSLKKILPGDIGKLNDTPLLNKINATLSRVQTLSWGTHVNTTSEFTCFGLPVTGFNFQTTNNGPIIQYTNVKQAPNLFLNTNKYFERRYIVYGLGWGKEDKWSVKMLYFSAEDKKAIKTLPIDSIEFFGPGLNRIISVISKINITPAIAFETELAGSETVKNKLLYSVANGDLNPIALYDPGFNQTVENIVRHTNTDYNRRVGYAGKINLLATIDATRTKITMGIRRTGKDFTTYGNPMLFNNTLTADIKITQPIYRNNVKLGGIFKYNNFYADSTGKALKTFYQYGIDLSVNFKSYPTLRLLYIPTTQIVNGKPLILNTLNAISNYSYKVKATTNLLTINILSQRTTKNAINNYYFKSTNAGVSNITQFNTHFSATVKYTFNYIGFSTFLNYINTVEVGSTYTFTKRHIVLNATLLYNKSNNNRKIGGSLEIQKPINEILSFSIRAERNSYSNYINNPLYPMQYNFPSYNEWLLYGSLNLKW